MHMEFTLTITTHVIIINIQLGVHAMQIKAKIKTGKAEEQNVHMTHNAQISKQNN